MPARILKDHRGPIQAPILDHGNAADDSCLQLTAETGCPCRGIPAVQRIRCGRQDFIPSKVSYTELVHDSELPAESRQAYGGLCFWSAHTKVCRFGDAVTGLNYSDFGSLIVNPTAVKGATVGRYFSRRSARPSDAGKCNMSTVPASVGANRNSNQVLKYS